MVGEAHQKDGGALGSEECIGVCQVKDSGGRVRESEKSWIGIQRSDSRGTEGILSREKHLRRARERKISKNKSWRQKEWFGWNSMGGDGSEQTDWRLHVLN